MIAKRFSSGFVSSTRWVLSLLMLLVTVSACAEEVEQGSVASSGYVGAQDCRACHEVFHEKWATSFHGLAMRPYSDDFAVGFLTPQPAPMTVEGYHYQACIGSGEGYIRETGASDSQTYPIVQVMGGKNVFFFLTELEQGRLQTLPLGYDVRAGAWYDMPAHAVRHALGVASQAYPWRDPAFTFNTSCFSCHVSQLSTNYDAVSDRYSTVWREPGINCETCHGPAEEHVRVCRESAARGEMPADIKLKVISQEKGYTASQVNDACSICHAKIEPITSAYVLGEDFFQHYDLATLEDPDFYPDGRDLGENYTFTLWKMNRCAHEGQLDCMHCHTSSGRYRFVESARANDACMPCHQPLVEKSAAHSRHPAGSVSDRCISCHMPMTEFGRMRRTDHSLRAPMPEATRAFGSPNACTLCHEDEPLDWAMEHAAAWYGVEYQQSTLEAGGLVQAARARDWSRQKAMLTYLASDKREEITAASLVRLLRSCAHEEKWPVLTSLLTVEQSPLLRARAAEALGDGLMPETVSALTRALRDTHRLVRIRAAAALAPVALEYVDVTYHNDLKQARDEFLAAMLSRPDNYASHYNLGVYYADLGNHEKAIEAYEKSAQFRSGNVAPLVNASISYNALNRKKEAETCLRRALEMEPGNSTAQLNLGLLLGEQQRLDEAAACFIAVLALESNHAVAAYNLGVIQGRQGRLDEAVKYCRIAWEQAPDHPNYLKTYAYYLKEIGDTETLENLRRQSILENTDPK